MSVDEDAVVRDYQARVPQAKILKQHGISRLDLGIILGRKGVEVRGPHPPRREWRAVMIAEDLYDKAEEHYDAHQEELKLEGIGSRSAYIARCLRQYLTELGAGLNRRDCGGA